MIISRKIFMIYEYSDLESNNEYLNSFVNNSVIQVNNLVDKKVCGEALDYFITNEFGGMSVAGRTHGLQFDQEAGGNIHTKISLNNIIFFQNGSLVCNQVQVRYLYHLDFQLALNNLAL